MKDDYNQIQEKTRLIAQQPGHYLVESVPGSGKTELAIQVAKALPGNKLIVTLQNRCVVEFNDRLNDDSFDEATTIHSLGFKLLKLDKKALGFKENVRAWSDNETYREFIAFAKSLRDLPITPDEFWRLYKSCCTWGGSYRDNAQRVGIAWNFSYNGQVRKAFNAWAEYKRNKNRVDFYDMILLPLKILKRKRVQAFVCQHTAIICDEIQDCSQMQLKLIVRLMKLVPTSVLVGDRMQSIFGFSGGIGEPFEYVRLWAKTKTLRMEYSLRLTREIADLAQLVMDPHYQGLEIKTTKRGTKPTIRLHDDRVFQYEDVALAIKELLEAGTDAREIVVVARTNASLRKMGDMLNRHSVPYQRKLQGAEQERIEGVSSGFKSFLDVLVNNDERTVTEYLKGHTTLELDVIETLVKAGRAKLKENDSKLSKHNKVCLRECIHAVTDCQGLTDTEVVKREYQNRFGGKINTLNPNGLMRYVKTLGIHLTGMKPADALKALENVGLDAADNELGVELLTIHKAKGGGWKYVFVIDVYEGEIPHVKNLDSIEELRIFFVAITRSSQALFISGINQEALAFMIEGKLEERGTVTTTYSNKVEQVQRDKKGHIKKRSVHRNKMAPFDLTRKMCRFLNVNDLHKVVDVKSIKHNEAL